MQHDIGAWLRGSRLRANPHYRLVARDPSPDSEADGDHYGDLCPITESFGRPRRGARAETAFLFLALRDAGPVPDYFRSLFGSRLEKTLARLLLDGILEIEQDGAFLSVPDVSATLLDSGSCAAEGRIADLSRTAICYAEALPGLSVPELAERLYGFGRKPGSAALEREIIANNLGIIGDERLGKSWRLAQGTSAHWVMWRPAAIGDGEPQVRFKLYVSPTIGHVGKALDEVADILGRASGVLGLKLGRGVHGLCRPDKMVAYFTAMDDLQEAGAVLCRRLDGCPAHGVPFTAELSADGLLSWGSDPPPTNAGPIGSWRLWIATRLAEHVTFGRAANVGRPLWKFAFDRLRLDGVNPETWIAGSDWSPRAARAT